MKRKFNYTGRKRIERKHYDISFEKSNGRPVSFSLNKLELNHLELPPEATVYLEAYYRTDIKRFSLGTAMNLPLPFSGNLYDFPFSDKLSFRIIVVDPETKRILASADRIKPDEPAKKKSILPVEFRDLGNQVWRVEFEGDEGSPILCLNNRIPNIENIARRDVRFFEYVYPAVIKEILYYMIFVQGLETTDQPEVEWHNHWLMFIRAITGEEIPDYITEDGLEREFALKWIDKVIVAFCDKYSNRFSELLTEEEG